VSGDAQRTTALVRAAAGRAGWTLTGEQERRLACFVDLLSRWSERVRLTADPDPRAIVQRHVVDAFALAQLLGPGDEEPPRRCVDVGAGGGLPGVPCAILLSRARLTLVEPRARRAAFLRTAVFELGLGCEVQQRRVGLSRREGGLPEWRSDVAWARATLPLARWLELGAALVRPGGWVIAFVTGDAADVAELLRERNAASPEALPLDLIAERRYSLVDGTRRRVVAMELCRRGGQDQRDTAGGNVKEIEGDQ